MAETSVVGIKTLYKNFAPGEPTLPNPRKRSIELNAKQIEQAVRTEREQPRIGKVKFYGVCDFCGRKIDITSKLEFNRKTELVDSFGTEKVGNEWVCKHEIQLQTCPFCEKVPF